VRKITDMGMATKLWQRTQNSFRLVQNMIAYLLAIFHFQYCSINSPAWLHHHDFSIDSHTIIPFAQPLPIHRIQPFIFGSICFVLLWCSLFWLFCFYLLLFENYTSQLLTKYRVNICVLLAINTVIIIWRLSLETERSR
jgi:hypothetical protein